jgi:hypothetical protein
MRIDSAGNLGLGVTPSAWVSNSKAIELPYGCGVYQYGGYPSVYFSANTIQTGASTFTYKTANPAAQYLISGNEHRWFRSTSTPSVGADPVFFQAMTLDASGRLLIGTTSGSGATMLNVNQPVASTDAKTIVGVATPTNAAYTAYVNSIVTNVGSENSTGGNLASGSSPYASVISNNGAYPIQFGTNNTIRATIDSSGNLLVGTTSVSSGLTQGFNVYINNGSSQTFIGHVTGTGSGTYYSGFSYNGTIIGSITQNGTTGVLYNLTSDYRLKNEQQPLTGAKEFIMALQPKKWQWWDGSGEGVGFVAHEFMEVAKYSGQGEKDAVDADGNPVYQSIQPSSSEVMANLVALLQEQQAALESLTTRLSALESK